MIGESCFRVRIVTRALSFIDWSVVTVQLKQANSSLIPAEARPS